MFIEHTFPRRAVLPVLQATCIFLLLVEVVWLTLFEAGSIRLRGSLGIHLAVIVACASLLLTLRSAHICLKINRKKIQFRFFPWQWQYQQVDWRDVERLRLARAEDLPALVGRPLRRADQTFLLTDPASPALWLQLTDGSEIFLSIGQRVELLAYLRKDLAMAVV